MLKPCLRRLGALLLAFFVCLPAVCPAAAADPVVNIGGVRIRKVLFAVSPADRQECMRNKESWGLKHCLSGGRDYLAGAAKACGGLQNLPTGKEAKELAVLLYGDDRGKDALYGPRDDRLLEQIGLPSSYDHLYVWLADETRLHPHVCRQRLHSLLCPSRRLGVCFFRLRTDSL